ncbi:MAG: flagellar hook-basal body complex protein [Alphaproteobacteria bacterium]|jgi:flagellar basal-body rod protein FlgF|nr:flagellar hook-basal body complex protein [Alphaproteobacteria bacterium]MBT4019195.1 flagellar hook-basal body complex protein [Alphaproteobacteria bacterium]MBT5160264.1 flagellar hook-basal body complex protein [Alphaproteobacteria bacterium]
MSNALTVSLSHQMVLKRQMEIIANNIANQSTIAFRSERPQFQEYLMDSSNGSKVSYVLDKGVIRNTKEGAFTPTSSARDLSISGKGYFTIQTEAGLRYTRNGHFRLNENSELTTMAGGQVMSTDNQPIVLDQTLGDFTVSRDGSITVGEGDVAKIKIVTFGNEQAMKKTFAGMYNTQERPTEAEDAEIVQFMLESSNVEPIMEMTNMIQVHRAYAASNKLNQTDHDIQSKMINKLGAAA